MVVRPDKPVRLVSEPLLEMVTEPPTHCSASRPARPESAVLVTVRLPEMHVVPAA